MYFDLPKLGQTPRSEAFAQEDALHKRTIDVESNAYIFGIEVEVENVPNPIINAIYRPYWTLTIDNSLRNNGMEYVSVPLKMNQIEGAIDQLNGSLPTNREFSLRTSVHVHMNVRDLTMEQITNLLLIYTAVEEMLFRWVGQDRDKNVFCVKLLDTEYADTYMRLQTNPNDTVHYWNKYTALNLHPIEEKGTVEFRHMHGTSDKYRLMSWINILACMKTAAKKYSLATLIRELQEMNSSSNYEVFVMAIFGNYAQELLRECKGIQQEMEDAISYIKLATIQTPTPVVTPAPPTIRPLDTLRGTHPYAIPRPRDLNQIIWDDPRLFTNTATTGRI